MRCSSAVLLDPHPTFQNESPSSGRLESLEWSHSVTLAPFLNNEHRTAIRISLLRLTLVQHIRTGLIYRGYDGTPRQSPPTVYEKPLINIA